jgi:hypothetical protein
MDPRTTKAITGHSSSDTHEKTYLHEYVDVMAREIEKMPRFLETLTITSPEVEASQRVR